MVVARAIVVDVVDDDGTGGAGVDGVDGEEILVVDVVLGGPVVVVEGFGATVVVVVVAPAAPRLDRVRLQSGEHGNEARGAAQVPGVAVARRGLTAPHLGTAAAGPPARHRHRTPLPSPVVRRGVGSLYPARRARPRRVEGRCASNAARTSADTPTRPTTKSACPRAGV